MFLLKCKWTDRIFGTVSEHTSFNLPCWSFVEYSDDSSPVLLTVILLIRPTQRSPLGIPKLENEWIFGKSIFTPLHIHSECRRSIVLNIPGSTSNWNSESILSSVTTTRQKIDYLQRSCDECAIHIDCKVDVLMRRNRSLRTIPIKINQMKTRCCEIRYWSRVDPTRI